MSQAERAAPPTPVPAPSGLTSDGEQLTLEVVDAGQIVGLITDHQGLPVYGNSRERVDAIVCVDDCTDAWVPLTPPAGDASTMVISDRLDPARLQLVERPDGGTQVAYNNTPLYTWTGDADIGVPNGAGVAGIWFALTTGGTRITGG